MIKFARVSRGGLHFSRDMKADAVCQMLLELRLGGVTHLLCENPAIAEDPLRAYCQDVRLVWITSDSEIIGAMEEVLPGQRLDQPQILAHDCTKIGFDPLVSVSVVVPWNCDVQDSAQLFRNFVKWTQTWPPTCELVVVLNGSCRRGTESQFQELTQILKESCAGPAQVLAIVCRAGIFRAGVARNWGAHHARAENLVFQDMDLRPALSFFEAPVTDQILLGLRENFDLKTGQRIAQDSYWDDFNLHAADRLSGPTAWKYVCSHSLKMKTADFLKAGGFAWSFQDYGHEDTEWAYRLSKTGRSFRAHPEVGCHLVRSLDRGQARRESLRRTGEIFLRLHPVFEVETFVSYLWKPSFRVQSWAHRFRNLFRLRGNRKTINTWGPNSNPSTTAPA